MIYDRRNDVTFRGGGSCTARKTRGNIYASRILPFREHSMRFIVVRRIYPVYLFA